jgi:hypothetical protein
MKKQRQNTDVDVMVRDVPGDVAKEIDRRAEVNGMSRQTYLHAFILVHFSKMTTRPDGALAGELWEKLADFDAILEETGRVSRARLVQYVLAAKAALADLVE